MTDSYKRRTGLWLVLAVLALTTVMAPLSARAADAERPKSPLHLTTSPLPISLLVKPGKTVTADLRVKQEGGSDERLKVDLMKFTAFGEEGKPRLLDRGPGDDYFNWVKFDKPVFNAPNNQWITVKMTISVPATAAFGYYYAAVFSRVGDDASAGGNTAAIAGGTAVLVLLNVDSPNAKRDLSLVSFGTEHRVVEFLPSVLQAKFVNVGNVHVKPSGNIFILNNSGKQVGSLLLNSEQGNILPQSKRVFQAGWTDGFPHYERTLVDGKGVVDRNGKQKMNLNWSFNTAEQIGPDETAVSNPATTSTNPLSKIRFGRYKAHLFAIYDNGKGRDIPIESDVTFWVVPWRALLVMLVILLLIGFAIYTIGRNAFRRPAADRLRKRR